MRNLALKKIWVDYFQISNLIFSNTSFRHMALKKETTQTMFFIHHGVFACIMQKTQKNKKSND